MKVVYSELQKKHDPKSFFSSGANLPNPEVPERAERLLAAAISVSSRHAAEASGVMNTGGNLIGVFGGLMVPLIAAKFGWTTAVASGSIFAFIGATLWLFIRADEPMIESEAVVPSKAVHAG